MRRPDDAVHDRGARLGLSHRKQRKRKGEEAGVGSDPVFRTVSTGATVAPHHRRGAHTVGPLGDDNDGGRGFCICRWTTTVSFAALLGTLSSHRVLGLRNFPRTPLTALRCGRDAEVVPRSGFMAIPPQARHVARDALLSFVLSQPARERSLLKGIFQARADDRS